MKLPSNLPKTLLVVGLIVLSSYIRTQQYFPNISPIAAIALFGGATLTAPWSFAVPLIAQFTSDVFIGFDRMPITYAIYASFIITVLFGSWLKKFSPWRMLGASLASSTLFYLVTNAAVWKFSQLYPQTGDGLIMSYLYAIPFFRNTLFGDLIYSASLFLAYFYLPVILKSFVELWHRLSSPKAISQEK